MSSYFLTANGFIDPGHMMRTLGIHSIPGLDIHEPEAFRHTRLICAESGTHKLTLQFENKGIEISSPNTDIATLKKLGEKVRAWLDLDTDLTTMRSSFSQDSVLGPMLEARPWLRLIGYLNGFEAAATTILGQQVSLAAGRTFGGRFVESYGSPGPENLLLFPTPMAVVERGVDELRETIGLTRSRAATLFVMAQSFAAKGFTGESGIPLSRTELLALRGVGPWTADYLEMRGRSNPDAFVPGDLVARRALNRITEREAAKLSLTWAPHRSYAMVHLWASDQSS